jgi:hypothetical protein
VEGEDRIGRYTAHGGRSKVKDGTRRKAQGPEIFTVNLVPCAVCDFASEQPFDEKLAT